MTTNQPTQLRMNERERQQTFQAAVAAIQIINQRYEALNKYRDEALTYAANNPGNYSFSFNMDFMKVSRKLMVGYVSNCYAQSQIRKWQVSAESLKIANETGAHYQEVRELFLLLMNKFIIS
jgi:hypothetical protein